MLNEVREIINKNIKVTEKLILLDKCQAQVDKEFDHARLVIKQGYKYCPLCKEYYRESVWEQNYANEKRTVCVSSVLAEWEQAEYKKKDVVVQYDICPVGHRCEVNVTY